VRVGDLSSRDLASRLRRPGLALHTGAFVIHLRTPVRAVADAVHTLYHDFPLEPDGAIADFHVELRRPLGPRRWWRRQARVVVDGARPFAPIPLALGVPMLEWSLNWCAATFANHFVMIHAAVVERGERAVVLPGQPGAGKSTLCAGLIHRGWRLLSDEFALVRPGDARLAPWPRPVSLKGPSIEIIRRFAVEPVIGPAALDPEKGLVAHLRPPVASVARAREPATAAWIVFPRYAAGAPAALTPIPKARAFFRLADYSYNQSSLGLPAFEALAHLIDTADAYEFVYGGLEAAIEGVDALASAAPAPAARVR
jgi:HprK-related kinase A